MDKIKKIIAALEAAGARTMLEQNYEGWRATIGTPAEWVFEQGALDLVGVEAFFRMHGPMLYPNVVLP